MRSTVPPNITSWRSSSVRRCFVVIVSAQVVGLCAAPSLAAAPDVRASLAFEPVSGSPLAVGPKPTSVAAADLDGDGFVDLAVGHAVDGTPPRGGITILFGDGTGQFARKQVIQLDGGGILLRIADVDRDGTPDIVAVRHDSHDVYVLRRKQNWAPPSGPLPQTCESGKAHTHALTLADYNGDGRLDLAAANADHGSISVLFGDGAGAFWPARGSPFQVGRVPYGLTSVDADKDGRIDLVVPLVGDRAVAVMPGDGRGGFGAAQKSELGRSFAVIGVFDLNGDGAPDVVVPDEALPGVRWRFNDGTGRFKSPNESQVRLPAEVWGVEMADLDGDGRGELILGGRRPTIYCIQLDGRDQPVGEPLAIPTGGQEPGAITVADVNGDRKPDILTGNWASGDVSVLLAR